MSTIQLIEKNFRSSFDEIPIIVISGPTGIGKSNLALSLAKKINGVIINADSMQIYEELKIISSQPSDKDKKKFLIHYIVLDQLDKTFLSWNGWN